MSLPDPDTKLRYVHVIHECEVIQNHVLIGWTLPFPSFSFWDVKLAKFVWWLPWWQKTLGLGAHWEMAIAICHDMLRLERKRFFFFRVVCIPEDGMGIYSFFSVYFQYDFVKLYIWYMKSCNYYTYILLRHIGIHIYIYIYSLYTSLKSDICSTKVQ